MSTLLQRIYKVLGIKGVRTTPYHPQTDGLVERFYQTLKTMLRHFVSEARIVTFGFPILLFAYIKVLQASTGFSPFELLYGRTVRGPIDVLKRLGKSRQLEQTKI